MQNIIRFTSPSKPLVCYAVCLAAQPCPAFCDPMDCSPPGYSVHGILQARILESEKKVKVKSLRRVRFIATPWIVAHQAPPSMGFSRQEYWSGLPCPSLGDLPNPGMETGSSVAGGFFTI